MVEQVSKSLPGSAELWHMLGIERTSPSASEGVPHLRLETLATAVDDALSRMDLADLVERRLCEHLQRRRGRI